MTSFSTNKNKLDGVFRGAYNFQPKMYVKIHQKVDFGDRQTMGDPVSISVPLPNFRGTPKTEHNSGKEKTRLGKMADYDNDYLRHLK